jgi:hypothetical protein
MKKNLLSFVFLTLICAITYNITAQELITGGDMESGDAWTQAPQQGTADGTTFTFGYSEWNPTGGVGNCLSAQGQGQVESLVYQQVTITPGNYYKFTGLVANVSQDDLADAWVEVILSRVVPVTDDGYHPIEGDYVFKRSSWNKGWPSTMEDIDGTFLEMRDTLFIENGDNDIILETDEFQIPDTVTVTEWYVGLKTGIWSSEPASGPTFNFVFDEVSLMDMGASGIKNTTYSNFEVNVYPSIGNGIVHMDVTSSKLNEYQLINTAGQVIESGLANKDVYDFSKYGIGLYMLKVYNSSDLEIHKIIIK